ncbi:hypothetical protein Tco_0562826, partial [Tanacetum coccineum]
VIFDEKKLRSSLEVSLDDTLRIPPQKYEVRL